MRRQLVSLQVQITHRNDEPSNSNSFVGLAGGEAVEVGILPDMKSPVEVNEEQEQPKNAPHPKKVNNI